MKVLMLNGSANMNGNTFCALSYIGEQLQKEGIDYEIFQSGAKPLRDCIGCGKCSEAGCIFNDDGVNVFAAKAKEADGFIFGTPVYYAHPSGRVLSFLDRAFYSSKNAFAFKPGASVAVARRAGTTASFDVMNKYFGISQMPIVGATYWNVIHGMKPGEVTSDEEGIQTMQNLAKNMAWMLKCLEKGKEAGIALPDTKTTAKTNFIRFTNIHPEEKKDMSKPLSDMTLEELWKLFPIKLTEHQDCWECWYAEEKVILEHTLPKAARINHIGSTSINSIWAKPIIDILVEVPKSTDLEIIKELLIQIGYICMSKSENRRSFNKGYTENGFSERVFHLHLRYTGDNDELYFRDYLIEYPDIAREYEALKLRLWKDYEHNRDAYTNAKTEFVKKYTDKAKIKYKNRITIC